MATTTYVGFYEGTDDSPFNASLRDTGSPPRDMLDKINTFQKNLPPTCKLIGSWVVSGSVPNVIVVEAESNEDLQHISNHYAGWIDFTWHPAAAMRRDW